MKRLAALACLSLLALLPVATAETYYLDPDGKISKSAKTAPEPLAVTLSDETELPGHAPTPSAEIDRVLRFLAPSQDEVFVDFGCGRDARWLIAASRYCRRCIGVEIDPQAADEARKTVKALGLSDRIEIIEGDATKIDVQADVGVAYLYPGTLEKLRDKIGNLSRFASYMHPVAGLEMAQDGDSFFWTKTVLVSDPVWNGSTYSGPVCTSPRCQMCQSIRLQMLSQSTADPCPPGMICPVPTGAASTASASAFAGTTTASGRFPRLAMARGRVRGFIGRLFPRLAGAGFAFESHRSVTAGPVVAPEASMAASATATAEASFQRLTPDQRAKLKAAGIDIPKLIALILKYGPQILQIILDILDSRTEAGPDGRFYLTE